jgi:hypothetical protein
MVSVFSTACAIAQKRRFYGAFLMFRFSSKAKPAPHPEIFAAFIFAMLVEKKENGVDLLIRVAIPFDFPLET